MNQRKNVAETRGILAHLKGIYQEHFGGQGQFPDEEAPRFFFTYFDRSLLLLMGIDALCELSVREDPNPGFDAGWPATILLRSLLEMWMEFKWVEAEPNRAKHFFKYGVVYQKKLIEKYRKANPAWFQKLSQGHEKETSRIAQEAKKVEHLFTGDTRKWHGRSYKKIVSEAGICSDWLATYELYCQKAHPSPANLVGGIDNQLEPGTILTHAMCLVGSMLRVLCTVCGKQLSQTEDELLDSMEPRSATGLE